MLTVAPARRALAPSPLCRSLLPALSFSECVAVCCYYAAAPLRITRHLRVQLARSSLSRHRSHCLSTSAPLVAIGKHPWHPYDVLLRLSLFSTEPYCSLPPRIVSTSCHDIVFSARTPPRVLLIWSSSLFAHQLHRAMLPSHANVVCRRKSFPTTCYSRRRPTPSFVPVCSLLADVLFGAPKFLPASDIPQRPPSSTPRSRAPGTHTPRPAR